MSASMGQHDSNEVLLSYLDREQSEAERARIEQHLAVCWLCRSRLQELERTAQEVARMVATGFVSSDRAAKARASFLAAQPALERVLQREVLPLEKPERWFSHTRFAIPASIAACLVLVFGWMLSRPVDRKIPVAPVRETARQIVERTELNERKQIVPRTVTHQVFEYRIQSGRKSRGGRVEFWSDGDEKRYASRMFDGGGKLIHAVWRPGSANAELLPAILVTRADPNEMQARFKGWLDRRSGEPLLLATEFVEYCRRAQLEITMTPLREVSESLVRLSATRFVNGARMELSLDVNAKNYRVRRQVLRIWRDEREMEFVLDARSLESLATVASAVFQPIDMTPEIVAVAPIAEPEPAIQPEPVIPQPVNLEKLEVAVLYALHVQGVFGRDSWEVRRDGDRIQILAVVATETRKEILLNALHELGREEALSANVQTWAESGWKPPTVSLSAGSSAALDHANAVFGDGWALQQLAERFNAARVAAMDDHSKALFERMLHDHLVSLRRGSVDLREALSQFAERPVVVERQRDRGTADWQDQVHELFRLTTQIRDQTQTLLLEPPAKKTADGLIALIDTLAREARELDLTLLRPFERK